MKSFREYAKQRGYKFNEIAKADSSDALTMDAKDFPIEECAPEVMKIHAAFQNPAIKNYFHELQKEKPDEKYFKFKDHPVHDRTAREIASTSKEFAKNLKFEKHKVYLIGDSVNTWLQQRMHSPQKVNPEFPCSWCDGKSEWKVGTTAHPNEVWVILNQAVKDGILPKETDISWSDRMTGQVKVTMPALRHLRKTVKIVVVPFKMPTSSEGEEPSRPRFGVGMSDDKVNFSSSSEALYFDIDAKKIYDPTMMGISDLRSKKPEEGNKKPIKKENKPSIDNSKEK
jgi:hypothetical protein